MIPKGSEVMLENPIFIKESFRKPLFNKEMEKELEKDVLWLQGEEIFKEFSADITNIISELLEINKSNFKGVDFNKKYFTYNKICDEINQKIDYCSFEESTNYTQFITENNEYAIRDIANKFMDKAYFNVYENEYCNMSVRFVYDLLNRCCFENKSVRTRNNQDNIYPNDTEPLGSIS